ncbi:MAG: hypothetical protein AAGH76_04815 [Pseudomonadota bacterium]
MPLPTVLRIVAGLIVVMVIGEYWVLDQLQLPPLGVVSTLVALSFTYQKWPTASAWLAAIMSVAAPIAALVGYLQGYLVLIVPVFDAVIFFWLLSTAIRELRPFSSAVTS